MRRSFLFIHIHIICIIIYIYAFHFPEPNTKWLSCFIRQRTSSNSSNSSKQASKHCKSEAKPTGPHHNIYGFIRIHLSNSIYTCVSNPATAVHLFCALTSIWISSTGAHQTDKTNKTTTQHRIMKISAKSAKAEARARVAVLLLLFRLISFVRFYYYA